MVSAPRDAARNIQARYGPLRLGIWAKNDGRQLSATVYDTRSRRNVFRRTIDGNVDDAKRQAILAARAMIGRELEVTWRLRN
jgi:hypothetical protein